EEIPLSTAHDSPPRIAQNSFSSQRTKVQPRLAPHAPGNGTRRREREEAGMGRLRCPAVSWIGSHPPPRLTQGEFAGYSKPRARKCQGERVEQSNSRTVEHLTVFSFHSRMAAFPAPLSIGGLWKSRKLAGSRLPTK